MARKKERILEGIRKEQIFEGALEIISRNGSSNTTLDQVAKAAGLSKGGISYYYSSKEELFKDVFTTFFQRVFTKAKERIDQCQDPLDKLLSFVFLFDENDTEIQYMYPLFFDCMYQALFDSDFNRLFHDWVSQWVELASAPLENILNNAQDVESTARLISCIYQGIATRWYLDREAHSTEWAVKSVKVAISNLLNPMLVRPETTSA